MGNHSLEEFICKDRQGELKEKMKKAILKEDVFSLATYKNTSPNVCKSWNEVITKL